jgi:uncharacterized membrane protein YeaQ/YmgE (transglycosylase-associated protein family)
VRDAQACHLLGILAWLLLGSLAGSLAARRLRGDHQVGVVGQVLLGIVGALGAGFLVAPLIGTNPVSEVEVRSAVAATIGAAIAILTWRAMTATPRTGRRAI